MGQVRAVVHSHAAAGQPPTRVAAEANALVGDAGTERLVTMAYLQIHPENRLVSWLRAGHPPMVVVLPDGRAQVLLGRGGLPLGVDPAAQWQEETLLLPAGSLLAICTDGLVESRTRAADEGMDQLADVLSARRLDDLELIADAVLSELTREHGQRDDIALIVLRLTGADDHGATRIVRRLPARSFSAPIARRFVVDVLSAWGLGDDLTETAQLLTTELVSNAARNADSTLELRVAHERGVVRIGVYDDSHRLPHSGAAQLDDTSGRGLQLVEMLSSSWGVEPQERGKVVWFELSGD
jgi:anti-sigma regulatory factor (Ser/Thr protein kinase)